MSLCQVLSNVQRGLFSKITKTIAAVFPTGCEKRKSKTTTTITARRKGDPQHYVEGKILEFLKMNIVKIEV